MKPFRNADRVDPARAGDGNLDEDVNEEAYRETSKQISGTINKTLES